jgi:hypothetical protein
MRRAVVRVPADESTVRNIEYVSLEEIEEACLLCVTNAFAIQQDELITQVAHLLGYKRSGANIRERIASAIASALEHGEIEIIEGVARLRQV